MKYKTYEVDLWANKERCNGEKDYSQKIEASIRGEVCAIQYDEGNQPGNEFPYHVLERLVMAETGGGACLKFAKWQREGLDKEYLLREEI